MAIESILNILMGFLFFLFFLLRNYEDKIITGDGFGKIFIFIRFNGYLILYLIIMYCMNNFVYTSFLAR